MFYRETSTLIYFSRILSVNDRGDNITYRQMYIDRKSVGIQVFDGICGIEQVSASLGIFRLGTITMFEIPSNFIAEVYNAYKDIIMKYDATVNVFLKTLNEIR